MAAGGEGLALALAGSAGERDRGWGGRGPEVDGCGEEGVQAWRRGGGGEETGGGLSCEACEEGGEFHDEGVG